MRYLGIDELYLGKALDYITIVRDLISGAVFFVGKGKGGDALKKFRSRLKQKAKHIKAVSSANKLSECQMRIYCQFEYVNTA